MRGVVVGGGGGSNRSECSRVYKISAVPVALHVYVCRYVNSQVLFLRLTKYEK